MAELKDYLGWLHGGDTGLSSETIWRHMMGVPEPADGWRANAYPLDPSDLGRCVRLLDRFPEWSTRISEMASHGPIWAVLAEHWDELVALYREELAEKTGYARRCYARMKALEDAARG